MIDVRILLIVVNSIIVGALALSIVLSSNNTMAIIGLIVNIIAVVLNANLLQKRLQEDKRG